MVQNADPTKEIVAAGANLLRHPDSPSRVDRSGCGRRSSTIIREELKLHNVKLAGAAKDAGVVEPVDYAVFQNHGYKGLYGGLDAQDIHRRKRLKKGQQILDHMGSTELARQSLPRDADRRKTPPRKYQGKSPSQSDASGRRRENAPDDQGTWRHDARKPAGCREHQEVTGPKAREAEEGRAGGQSFVVA